MASNVIRDTLLKWLNAAPRDPADQPPPAQPGRDRHYNRGIGTIHSDEEYHMTQRFQRYDEIDAGDADVTNMLDIVSEEATTPDRQRNAPIWANCPGNDETEEFLNNEIRRLRLDLSATTYCRSIAKYGRFVVRPIYVLEGGQSTTINDADPEIEESWSIGWLDDQMNSDLEEQYHYYRNIVADYDDRGLWVGYRIRKGATMALSNGDQAAPWDFIEFKLGTRRLGKSFLEKLVDKWVGLHRMEQAMELNRVARSPQLHVHKVPVGNATPQEASAIIQQYRRHVAQEVKHDNNTGSEAVRTRVASPLESMYIPVSQDGTSGDLDVVQNDMSVRGIQDIEYAHEKLLTLIWSVPTADSVSSLGELNRPMSSLSARIARKVRHLQEAYMEGVDRILQISLSLEGIEYEPGMYELQMTSPSDLEDTLYIEKLQFANDVVDQLFAIGESVFPAEEVPTWRRFLVEEFLSPFYGDMVSNYSDYKEDQATGGETPVSKESRTKARNHIFESRLLTQYGTTINPTNVKVRKSEPHKRDNG